jgi:hypothetical protein
MVHLLAAALLATAAHDAQPAEQPARRARPFTHTKGTTSGAPDQKAPAPGKGAGSALKKGPSGTVRPTPKGPPRGDQRTALEIQRQQERESQGKVTQQNVLKTRHDTAKSRIENVR